MLMRQWWTFIASAPIKNIFSQAFYKHRRFFTSLFLQQEGLPTTRAAATATFSSPMFTTKRLRETFFLHVLDTRSWLEIVATRSWLPDPGFQTMATRSWLPDPGCQILACRSWLQIRATRSWLPNPRFHILATRSLLSCPGYPIRILDPGRQILPTRWWLPDPGDQIRATRSWLPDHSYQILAITSRLPDPYTRFLLRDAGYLILLRLAVTGETTPFVDPALLNRFPR